MLIPKIHLLEFLSYKKKLVIPILLFVLILLVITYSYLEVGISWVHYCILKHYRQGIIKTLHDPQRINLIFYIVPHEVVRDFKVSRYIWSSCTLIVSIDIKIKLLEPEYTSILSYFLCLECACLHRCWEK